LSRFGLRETLDFLGTWAVHLLSASVMLRLVGVVFRRARPRSTPTWGVMLATVLISAAVAWMLHMALAMVRVLAEGTAWADLFRQDVPLFLCVWSLSIATLLVAAFASVSRSRAAADAWHDEQLHSEQQAHELASARLQLLQAQVEPHFIFNALANVRRLLRTDPPAARGLLSDLRRYFEEALPALRSETSTLGREGELVRAYLAVHQVRMGARLQSEIDIPAALADHPVPSMMLLTLVENALKHGLQPLVDGGSISVSARADAGRITLTVADTGRGMGSGSGQGTGLANLRSRLKSIYGAAASLALAINEPCGVIATVSIPERA
jgi:signal transduction histidine kinase